MKLSHSALFRLALLSAVVLPATSVVAADDAYHISLTSPAGKNIESVSITSAEVTPECSHDWSVTKTTLRGGRQEGVELITVDNGMLKLVLCPTRGMGIMSVTMRDFQLKWDSPVTEIVHPHFIDLNSRGGLGWLEGFNEFMCRCGLESNGHPGTDRFVNNVGDEAEMELTLHGKIANIPASSVEVTVDRQAPYTIRIRGQVNEKFLFGPKLELRTEIAVVPGETSFQLTDVVTNVGAQEQEFQILYHANFGRPFLQQGSQVVAPVKTVKPFNDHAAAEMDRWATYSAPTTGFIEQVYLLTLRGDENNHTAALLHNKSMDSAASISWSLDELPYLTVWKNTGAVEDGYVTGIEPGTNYPNNRSVEREAGRVPKLSPGESRQMSLTFRLLTGIQTVKRAVANVEDIGMAGESVDGVPSVLQPKK